MRRWLACLLSALSCMAVHVAAADPIPDDVGTRVAESYAGPVLSAFEDAADEMERLAVSLCAQADGEALAAARAGFARLVPAWGRASVLRFGPLHGQNRFERIFFWPDPRGVIVRQVQAVLAAADETTLPLDGLSARSVALQGLSALEFMLHGSGAEELAAGEGGYRCRYGVAVAGNVARMARELREEWAPGAAFHAAFTAPSADGDPYRSPKEVAGEVVKALGTGLQFVRNAEIVPALGETAQKARGRRAPLWRSDLTFALAGAQIDGLSALVAAAGFGEAGDTQARGIVDSLQFDLRHAGDALAAVSSPAEEAFAQTQDRERIRYAAVVLEAANATVGERLSAALGLTMGFNALDGD